MEGKLVIISAPSGAGKTTIVRHLLRNDDRLEFSISATTRKPRITETNGIEYYFMTVDEFRKKIRNNSFVEWEEVYKDHYYGTLKSEIERIWSAGRAALFDVDVKGGINLKKIFSGQAVSIFIMPPSVEELEKRLNTRATDSPEKIRMRVEKAKEEIKLAERFDYIVVNDILEKAQDETLRIVNDFLVS